MHRGHGDLAGLGEQQRRGHRGREHEPAVAAGQAARARPDHLAGRGELVQQRGGVAGHPAGQDQGFQCRGRDRGPGQLLDHVIDLIGPGGPAAAAVAAGLGSDLPGMLPGGQERGERTGQRRLDLLAQPGQAAPAQQPEHTGLAPLGSPAARTELALSDRALRGQPVQRACHHRDAQTVSLGECRGGERAVRSGVPQYQVADRIGHRLGEGLGHAGRQGDAERVPQPARILDGRPALLPGDPDLQHPALRSEAGDPAGGFLTVSAPLDDLAGGERPQGPEQVSHALGVAAGAAGRQPLEFPFCLVHDRGIQQLPHVSLAEQLGQQAGIQGQRLRAALGQRRVTLIHERAHVAEQQRAAERRRGRRLDIDQPDPARGQVAHQADQPWHVEHVLQALAQRLQHDRERPVLAGHGQQLG